MPARICTEPRPSRRFSSHKQFRFGWLMTGVVVVALCGVIRHYWNAEPASAEVSRDRGQRPVQPPQTQSQTGKPSYPDPVAVVNNQDIRRLDLENACVVRFGEEVLESMVNKHLISMHCRRRGITVTEDEIDAEIDRMAEQFKITRGQFLDLLQRERGIHLDEYRQDMLWTMLALRKLAADKLTVDQDELQSLFETQYGPQVQARLIVVDDEKKAHQLHARLMANPGDFARLAIEESSDVNSASIGGLIQPIRRHMGDPAIQKEVFQLPEGAISSIIRVGNQYAILKCEKHIAPQKVSLDRVRQNLVEQIKEKKLRGVANELFASLQKSATITNVYNNPSLQQQMPGVVATVNGDPITLRRLGEECLRRHGEETLQIEISHLLLRQSLQAAGLSVTDEDLDAEVRHAAILSGVVDQAGNPDLEKWMKMATGDRGISRELYYRDSVWPSAALKKLVGSEVRITDEDMKKAYEANYGEKVRCRAIVMTNLRKAQQVWDMARRNPTVENFSALAAEYSIEPTSGSLRGEVPPIRRYGGQPQIEQAAFALEPGQISGIIHIADKAVILFCEGRTEPEDIKLEDVEGILRRDLEEKKVRMAMTDRFEQMQKEARIDNYLAGTSQAPKRPKASAQAASAPVQRSQRTSRHDPAVRPTSGSRQPRGRE